MTRTLRIIGIGAGDPRQVTLQALDAMAGVDAFFVLDKGAEKDSLVAVRRQICDEHLGVGAYRVVEIADPPRDRQPVDYDAEVLRWHDARAQRISAALRTELPEGGVGAILVWGDPALYDSTLRIAEAIAAGGEVALALQVIPGVTSASALTAAHGISANRIGEPITITTGRRLADTPPGADTNQIVMLDADCTFRRTADPDDHIWWGAYLGMDHEILIAGTVAQVGEQIAERRARARAEHGWIMDIYLLRKRR
ncbi:precorrin-6A synthase (deacetylating) [Williamsia sp. CHRR-6]|uniref:precorrin-6A synthase (deacetylating) n=1 Tax=Williamsia sp. CHRR-6 TaxID=2835871 RepID=UPI001BD9350F|nr:precorrin-6A synthase (deacetylating) [Williamsia sp. CHRR-6]MBT0566532.1 precorrin-6A synthase (deacetylating) [Williamsia sp. CHRR-6]